MMEGEHIRLRAIERTDLPRFQEWLNDPRVTEGLSEVAPLSMVDEEEWFAGFSGGKPEEKPLAIDVRGERDWELIGNTRFFHLNWIHRSAEFGIIIGDKRRWDQGLGTEALELMLAHAFDTLNLNRVFLRVFATNLRARRSYEKAGFVVEGTFRQGVYRGGRYIDVIQMSILRSEWRARREGK